MDFDIGGFSLGLLQPKEPRHINDMQWRALDRTSGAQKRLPEYGYTIEP